MVLVDDTKVVPLGLWRVSLTVALPVAVAALLSSLQPLGMTQASTGRSQGRSKGRLDDAGPGGPEEALDNVVLLHMGTGRDVGVVVVVLSGDVGVIGGPNTLMVDSTASMGTAVAVVASRTNAAVLIFILTRWLGLLTMCSPMKN